MCTGSAQPGPDVGGPLADDCYFDKLHLENIIWQSGLWKYGGGTYKIENRDTWRDNLVIPKADRPCGTSYNMIWESPILQWSAWPQVPALDPMQYHDNACPGKLAHDDSGAWITASLWNPHLGLSDPDCDLAHLRLYRHLVANFFSSACLRWLCVLNHILVFHSSYGLIIFHCMDALHCFD